MGLDAALAEEARHERRRRRAVDVVVAVDEDALLLLDRLGEATGGAVHVPHEGGVVEVGKRGAEEQPRRLERLHAAEDEGAGEGFGEVVELLSQPRRHVGLLHRTQHPAVGHSSWSLCR